MNHLDWLESEAIYIMREAAASQRQTMILFSAGKDSITLAHLARKAFWPNPPPFPLLHVDTGHNFPEAIAFRDRFAAAYGAPLVVRKVQDSIDKGRVAEARGVGASRNALQSVTLLDAVSELELGALIGGARRDEEKARAKERIFSVRNEFGEWEPRAQRPELWDLYNGHLAAGEHLRIFPLSNWLELDVWDYLQRERVELPSLYFAHTRAVVRQRGGTLLAYAPFMELAPDDALIAALSVRCRTVGDMTCTGLVESRAGTVDEVLSELRVVRTSERLSRADDQLSPSAMEDRKRAGYF